MSNRFPSVRPRRLRQNESLRSIFQETEFSLNDLVLPIFVEEEIDDFVPIKSMPGVMRIPESKLAGEDRALCPCRHQVGDDLRRVASPGQQRQ